MKLIEELKKIRRLCGLNEDYKYDDYDDEEGETDDEGSHFTSKLSDDEKRGRVTYTGRNITWFGTPGVSAIIPIEMIDTTEGNQFDEDKLDSLYNQINNLSDNIELSTSYCDPYIVTIGIIKEEQESYHLGRFETDYDGRETPFTTGDSDLDFYIASYHTLDEVIESSSYEENLFKKYHMDIGTGRKTLEQLKYDFDALMEEDDTYREEIEEGIDEMIRYENMLKDSISNEYGDINTMRFQLRDGNHRFTVAKRLGEKVILCDIAKSSQISVDDVSKFVKVL